METNRGLELANNVYNENKYISNYRLGKVYSTGDVVLSHGRYYISVSDNNEEEPYSSRKWDPLC